MKDFLKSFEKGLGLAFGVAVVFGLLFVGAHAFVEPTQNSSGSYYLSAGSPMSSLLAILSGDYNSSTVTANESGNVLERLEFIQSNFTSGGSSGSNSSGYTCRNVNVQADNFAVRVSCDSDEFFMGTGCANARSYGNANGYFMSSSSWRCIFENRDGSNTASAYCCK